MLEIILHILAVTGIVLLALFTFLLLVIALVLFFPVSYRICGEKEEENLTVAAKAKWLFGLVRVSYRYPEPGRVIVKVLPFTVYDSKTAAEKKQEGESAKKNRGKKSKRNETSAGVRKLLAQRESVDEAGTVVREEYEGGALLSDGKESTSVTESAIREESIGGEEVSSDGKEIAVEAGMSEEEDGKETSSDRKEGTEENDSFGGRISQKIEKIRYTIQGICDKIKGIWGNISYYTELLQEEDTKQLFSYTAGKLAVILRHLRPKRVSADVLFGTGSPDTTGYIYGAYCMLSGAWGGEILMTPDFERQIFKGRFDASGRITVWVLTVNVLKVVLDKRLQSFIHKLKARKKGGS